MDEYAYRKKAKYRKTVRKNISIVTLKGTTGHNVLNKSFVVII